MSTYKCCYNCLHGSQGISNEGLTDNYFCNASPSIYGKNPYKARYYCKHFQEHYLESSPKSITRQRAIKLLAENQIER